MKKKKIALLDLGGVVFQSKGISTKEINWDIIWDLNQKYGAKMDLGGHGFLDFLIEYNKLTKQDLNEEKFLEKVFDTLDFNQALIDFLRADRDIIIVSDNYRENINYISKRYDFSSWAIQAFYSFQYKMYKSNTNFFKKLRLDINEYNLEDLIFIDDSKSKLDSAAQNGIHGFLYENNEQIIKEIQNYNQKNL